MGSCKIIITFKKIAKQESMGKKIFYMVMFIIALTTFYTCTENISKGTRNNETGYGADDVPPANINPQVDVKEVIQSLPSPIEMAALIKSSGVPFSRNYLANTEDVDDFETNFKKALGLGVLSADLGYLNVYAKNNEIVNVLASIRKISDDLSVGQFFDFHTLKKIATTGNDLDTLIFLSQTSFRDMDNHLRKMRRSNLSALMVTGVWVEGLYLVTQIVKKDEGNSDLKETIGQQKASLGILNKVVQSYKELDKNFAELAADINKLQQIYEQITIEETEGEIKTIQVDGQPVVTTTGESILKMTDEQLTTIIRLTENIREKLISI